MRRKLKIQSDHGRFLGFFIQTPTLGRGGGEGLKPATRVLPVDKTQNPKSGPGRIESTRPEFSPL